MIIDWRIAGIPCQIKVTHYEPYRPGFTSGRPEACYESEGGWCEFDVLDRRGNPAKWLEKKLTDEERERIDLHVWEVMEG